MDLLKARDETQMKRVRLRVARFKRLTYKIETKQKNQIKNMSCLFYISKL